MFNFSKIEMWRSADLLFPLKILIFGRMGVWLVVLWKIIFFDVLKVLMVDPGHMLCSEYSFFKNKSFHYRMRL